MNAVTGGSVFFGPLHVDHALDERFVQAVGDEGGVQLVERLAFVAHGSAELFGHDARQVVGGQVLRPEDRDASGAGP